jgi:hypothetical protein
MPDEINVDATKFDEILGRMLAAGQLLEAEIGNRVQAERIAKRNAAFARHKQGKAAKKLGQLTHKRARVSRLSIARRGIIGRGFDYLEPVLIPRAV